MNKNTYFLVQANTVGNTVAEDKPQHFCIDVTRQKKAVAIAKELLGNYADGFVMKMKKRMINDRGDSDR